MMITLKDGRKVLVGSNNKEEIFQLSESSDIETQKISCEKIYSDNLDCSRVRCWNCPLNRYKNQGDGGCGWTTSIDLMNRRRELLDAFIIEYNKIKAKYGTPKHQTPEPDNPKHQTLKSYNPNDWKAFYNSLPYKIILDSMIENIKETNSKLESFFKPYENFYMKENAELKDKVKELTTQLNNANSEAVELKNKLTIINETSALKASNDAYVLKLEVMGIKEFEILELYYNDKNGTRCRIGRITPDGKCFIVSLVYEKTNWESWKNYRGAKGFREDSVEWKGHEYHFVDDGNIYLKRKDLRYGFIYNIDDNTFCSSCEDDNIVRDCTKCPIRF